VACFEGGIAQIRCVHTGTYAGVPTSRLAASPLNAAGAARRTAGSIQYDVQVSAPSAGLMQVKSKATPPYRSAYCAKILRRRKVGE